jgi:periplasmic divalent cation tolerance protein
MADIVVLFVTITPAHAEAFVRQLVEERVVACGNILPGACSHYWWNGELCRDEEAIVFMEAPRAALEKTIARVEALHPYDTPKVVALDPAGVNDEYAAWVLEETTGPPRSFRGGS